MRNLVVCCDGTWNTPDQTEAGVPVPTNVVRLFNALAEKDSQGYEQLKYYHPGVGTEGNWWERLLGGAIGIGLDRNIMSAYKWLGMNYREGDRIFLFGFSRGAYTVRSVAGMISTCGLLNPAGLSDGEIWKRAETACTRGYRPKGNAKRAKSEWAGEWSFHGSDLPDKRVSVFFLGVWDTVGALGIPDDLAAPKLVGSLNDYMFHDTHLGEKVEHARHAVALDEMRANLSPTLWTQWEPRQDVKQLWFPGAHSDVGGGYAETGLSNGALQWIIDEASAPGIDLQFQPGMLRQVRPDCQDVSHNSTTGLFRHLRTQPRSIPLLTTASRGGVVHDSALDRQAGPPIVQAPYHPTVVLPVGGQTVVPVYANQRWNETRVYLEAGAVYECSATGEWLDRTIASGPDGGTKRKFQLAVLVRGTGSWLGKRFKIIVRNREAGSFATRRQEGLPWFALVGAVANSGNPTPHGTPAPHEIIRINDHWKGSVGKSGYLYCFANDAWRFYDNNRGSVVLTVKRIS